MKFYISLVLLCLSACGQIFSEVLPPEHEGLLAVKAITVGSKDNVDVRQIVFAFNQDVALFGQTPSQSQINAIQISPIHVANCHWRFLQLHQLACDLEQVLAPQSRVVVSIDKTFTALDKDLHTPVRREIIVPPDKLGITVLEDTFPSEIVLTVSRQNEDRRWTSVELTDDTIEAAQQYLKIRLPDGSLNDVIISKGENVPRGRIRLSKEVDELPTGLYQYVLMPGYRTQPHQVPLAQEILIDSYTVYDDFRFLGFACQTYKRPTFYSRYENVDLQDDGVLPCESGLIYLKFSEALSNRSNGDENESFRDNVSWLQSSQPYSVKGLSRINRGVFYYGLDLTANGQYTLELEQLVSTSGKSVLNPNAITWRTSASHESWKIADKENVFRDNKPDAHQILVFGSPDTSLQQEISVIDSPQSLWSFLHGQLAHRVQSHQVTNKQQALSLNTYKAEEGESTLLHHRLTGNVFEPRPYFYRIASQRKIIRHSEAVFTQRADFNILLLNRDPIQLLVADWSGKPIAEVALSLVCHNQSEPLFLGYTDARGIFKGSPMKQLTNEQSIEDCWLWGTHSASEAAVLPLKSGKFPFRSELLTVDAWTSQPLYAAGDTVHLGMLARKSSLSGLVQAIDPIQHELLVTSQHKGFSLALPISKVSRFGFVESQFSLPKKAPYGSYFISLVNKLSGHRYYAGYFTVNEFEVPEFEVSLTKPSKVTRGGNIQVSVDAKRLNGEALKSGKVVFKVSVESGNEPNSWPKDFDFLSFDDNYLNQSESDELTPHEGTLNDEGEYLYTSVPVLSKRPYGRAVVSASVTAIDGETQHTTSHTEYYGRQHYIGTQFDDESDTLHVIAIDERGRALQNVPTVINRIIEERHTQEEAEVETLCEFQTLPARCQIDPRIDTLTLSIESGEQKYQWQREYQNTDVKKATKAPYISEDGTPEWGISLNVPKGTHNGAYIVGEEVEFEVLSSIAGTVTFVLETGGPNKIWQQKVPKGRSKVTLPVENSWLSTAVLNAVMPISETLTENREELIFIRFMLELKAYMKLNLDLEAHSSPVPNLRPPERRYFSDSSAVKVITSTPHPNVKLSSPATEATAGSKITLTVVSDRHADTQLWLVNEGFNQLGYAFSVADQEYDLNDSWYPQPTVKHSGVKGDISRYLSHRRDPTLPEFAHKPLSAPSLAYDAGVEPEPPQAVKNDHGDTSMSLDNRQSVWLGTVALKANIPHEIDIKLPDLIGRWKVIAVTTTEQTMSVESTRITTHQNTEYFLDLPTDMYTGDSVSIGVSMINPGQKTLTDEITLWVDNAAVDSILVSLAANGYKRAVFSPRQFPSGIHTVSITSQNMPAFVAGRTVVVASDTLERQKTWLVTPDQKTRIVSPTKAVAGSLTLESLPAENMSVNWQILTEHNQQYPHQCFEQSLSRAVSYSKDVEGASHWPRGTEELTRLVNKQFETQGYRGVYQYFPGVGGDSLWLSIYAHIVYAWLVNTPMALAPEIEEELEFLSSMAAGLFDNVWNLEFDETTRSMAFFALALNGDMTLDEALAVRHKLGSGDTLSKLLQAAALKQLEAPKSVYYDDLKALLNSGYQDQQVNVFNDNSQKCIAIMSLDKHGKHRQQLVSQVLKQQYKDGHFGSTLADAFCAVALHDDGNEEGHFSLHQFNNNGEYIDFEQVRQNHWLQLSYQQPALTVSAQSNGLSLTRTLWVKRNQQWQLITPATQLSVGELVKTTLTLNTPIERTHIAITDTVAGGLVAINPQLNNQLFIDEFGDKWHHHYSLQIRDGKVHWYAMTLEVGKKAFSYYSRVRHSGRFLAAPATAEHMYQAGVNANTEAMFINIAD